MFSYRINCTDCGHCIDLKLTKATDSPNLTYARKMGVALITQWLEADLKSNRFDGAYSDPFHPGCARMVFKIKDGKFGVSGEDGDKGSPHCANPVAWGPLEGVETDIYDDYITIDFSPKGGPSNLTARYDYMRDGIVFSDGNLWTKISNPYIFEGEYSDPNHPGCWRNLECLPNSCLVYGTDGDKGSLNCANP